MNVATSLLLRCKCENLSHLSHDGVEVAVPQPPLFLQAVKEALKVAHLWQIVELAGDTRHKCSFHKLSKYPSISTAGCQIVSLE